MSKFCSESHSFITGITRQETSDLNVLNAECIETVHTLLMVEVIWLMPMTDMSKHNLDQVSRNTPQ